MSAGDPAAAKGDAWLQTSVRLGPEMWAALNDLATRMRGEEGQRVTVHDRLIEGARHILAVNDPKQAKVATRQDIIDLRTAFIERIDQVKIELERQIGAYGR
jgi:hypothetical protein